MWWISSKVPTMQDELVMVSGMPILNGFSNQHPLTFTNKPTSKISTWGSSFFLPSDPTFLLLIDFAKIDFVQSAGDQHVSEIALMALDLLAGNLIIIIIIIIIRPLGSSRRLTLRLGRSARKWEVLIFRYKHTLHHNKYIIIIIIIICVIISYSDVIHPA